MKGSIALVILLFGAGFFGYLVSGQESSTTEEPSSSSSSEEIIRISKNYSLGSRVSGDALVGFESDEHLFPSERNLQLTIKWPQSGATNKVLTRVAVYTNSTASFGTAMLVLSGGTNQNFVTIGVQANNTRVWDYRYEIYAI